MTVDLVRKVRFSFLRIILSVIPGPAQPEPGIHGPALQPLKRLKGCAMDSGSAPDREGDHVIICALRARAVRNDGGMCFDVRIHHGRFGEFPCFKPKIPKCGAPFPHCFTHCFTLSIVIPCALQRFIAAAPTRDRSPPTSLPSANDPVSAARHFMPRSARDDGGICFNVRIHHGRHYTAVPKVFDIYRRNAGFKAEYPPAVVLLGLRSTYPCAPFKERLPKPATDPSVRALKPAARSRRRARPR